MVTWRIVFTKQTQKDAKKLSSAGLQPKAQRLLEVLSENPFLSPPAYENLVVDLAGTYSRQVNIKHRHVYQVIEDMKPVKALRMWTHYERVVCISLIGKRGHTICVSPPKNRPVRLACLVLASVFSSGALEIFAPIRHHVPQWKPALLHE